MRTCDLVSLLRDRGQRVTSQRLVLHAVLSELDRHVTAEEVMRAAEDRLPGLSLPTVYATLDLFEAAGLLRRVPVSGGAVRYDPRTDEHSHLVCRACGEVTDLEAVVDPAPVLAAAGASGARVERTELVVSGLCGACATERPEG